MLKLLLLLTDVGDGEYVGDDDDDCLDDAGYDDDGNDDIGNDDVGNDDDGNGDDGNDDDGSECWWCQVEGQIDPAGREILFREKI